jgi:excisionase family DNA binding protein
MIIAPPPAQVVKAPIKSWLMVKMDEPMEPRRYNISSQDANNPSLFTDPLWTVEDVTAYLKLQPETVHSMARRGELPALKIGKVWRFQKHAIHKMPVNMY